VVVVPVIAAFEDLPFGGHPTWYDTGQAEQSEIDQSRNLKPTSNVGKR